MLPDAKDAIPGRQKYYPVLMCYMSEDFRERMEAFLNKRKPVWKGR